MDWTDLRNAAAEAKPFHRPGGVDPASAWVDAERLTALLARHGTRGTTRGTRKPAPCIRPTPDPTPDPYRQTEGA